MKKVLFNKVAILGLGLIGGSLALEMKSRGLAREIRGYNRSKPGRALALKRKACDQVFEDPAEAVAGADLVVLATPVQHIPELAAEVAKQLKPGAIVTDVGSTKQRLMKALGKALPKHAVLIGGHPIAGTEQNGMAAAITGLFEGRWWILTPAKKVPSAALKKFERLVQAVGAKPVLMDAEEHDQILAAISHLPHMLAFSLSAAARQYAGGRALQFAGTSFHDATRVAASSAVMWRDIALDNRESILEWIERFESELGRLKKFVKKSDAVKLQRFFAAAAEVRREL